MSKEAKAYNAQVKMQELDNQKTYFDLETNRLEQKCRVKDAFPVVNNLVKLNIRSSVVEEIYYNNVKENFHSDLIKDIRAMKMEFSISIDGLGRQEFIKLFKSKVEEEDNLEGNEDMLQKFANAIG